MQLPGTLARAPPASTRRSPFPPAGRLNHYFKEASVYVVMNSKRVQELREEKGLSKRALAGVAGISETTARRVELEEPVSFRTGRKVAEALGVEPSPSLGRML
jgi:DNA-binding XRE family transcriptional regulator